MPLISRRSLTFRLTLLFASASAAVLLALGLLIGDSVERHFEELDVEALTGHLQLVQHALARVQSRSDLEALPQQLDNALLGHHGLAVTVSRPDGKPLFETSGTDFPQALLDRAANGTPAPPVVWENSEGTPFRGIAATAPTGVEDWAPTVVAVATDTSHHQHFMASFQRTLWLVIACAAALTGFLGWIVARRELAPLRAIRQGASEITAPRLSYRLPVEAIPVELGELVETLNDMLARLEASFQRLSNFSSDLAHELRTPVSNMLMQTQVTLARARSADEYKDVLYSNAEEFERLARMISDMLFLAKADHGLTLPSRELVDLAAEVEDLFSFFELLADGKNVQLTLTGAGSVPGDRMLLRRAISNLLANAIRHTPENGRVGIVLERHAERGELLLSIENTGNPIPAEHIPRLFDRFYRADASRHESSEGAGLGLAITQSIIALHGGTIGVQAGTGATRFEIRLPDAGVRLA
jgi:two-component system heavy metal sensor histidine kinase CusS